MDTFFIDGQLLVPSIDSIVELGLVSIIDVGIHLPRVRIKFKVICAKLLYFLAALSATGNRSKLECSTVITIIGRIVVARAYLEQHLVRVMEESLRAAGGIPSLGDVLVRSDYQPGAVHCGGSQPR